MRIAVIGAGSVGGYVGAKLAFAGNDITFIARGATLAAIQRDGFTLIDHTGQRNAVPAKAAALDKADRFDAVILAVKAHQIAAVAPGVMALLEPDAPLVALQNGVPWWYFYKAQGAYDGRPIAATDPDGIIGRSIDPARVLGAVIYVGGSIESPGVVRVGDKAKLIVGEPDGSISARVHTMADCFDAAGVPTTLSQEIRTDIWVKLWGNLMFNPLSALTRAGLADICRDPATRALARAGMLECETVAARLGVRMPIDVEERIAITESLGNHKTSMLQDIEAGRPPETDTMGGAVAELAQLLGIATPRIDAVYACTTLLARMVSGKGV